MKKYHNIESGKEITTYDFNLIGINAIRCFGLFGFDTIRLFEDDFNNRVLRVSFLEKPTKNSVNKFLKSIESKNKKVYNKYIDLYFPLKIKEKFSFRGKIYKWIKVCEYCGYSFSYHDECPMITFHEALRRNDMFRKESKRI